MTLPLSGQLPGKPAYPEEMARVRLPEQQHRHIPRNCHMEGGQAAPSPGPTRQYHWGNLWWQEEQQMSVIPRAAHRAMAGPTPGSRTMLSILWLRGIWEQTCPRALTPGHSCQLSLSEWRGSRTPIWCDWWRTTWGRGPSLTMAAVRHGKLAEGIATSLFMAGEAAVWDRIYCLNPWAIIHGHGSLQEATSLFGLPDSRGKSWTGYPWPLLASSRISSISVIKGQMLGNGAVDLQLSSFSWGSSRWNFPSEWKLDFIQQSIAQNFLSK